MTIEREIVVSGISGQYPLSDDLEKFKENLFAGIDMVTADAARWPIGYHKLPHRNGKVFGMDKFDHKFFGISKEDVPFIDPQDRMLLEEVYLAITDAGVDPDSLKGTNTGYFHGACYVETNRDFESAETMPSNKVKASFTRVPQWLQLRGPILDVDTACCSGLSAFSEAFHSIKNGICDQAIATASNTLFRPRISMQFRDLKMVTQDGKCKCLDSSADGYVRSEAVVAVFLQRSRDAKRIYCHLLSCRSNSDGYKEEGITFPSVRGQTQLLRDTYADANINPSDIDYIEAHITGTKAGDPVETNAMHEVICKNRTKPVMIGCLKSNIGHTEGSSGLCAISKAIIIYQMKKIPPNLHYNSPNLELKGLNDGTMAPVVKTTAFDGRYIPVNCFGFGGANTHLITAKPSLRDKSVDRPVNRQLTDQSLPYRLILIPGRIKESVDHIISSFRSKPMYLNREFLSLLNDFSKIRRNDFNHKGYMIIQETNGIKKVVMQPAVKQAPENEQHVSLEFLSPDAKTADLFDSARILPVVSDVASVYDRVKRSICSCKTSEIIAKNVALQIGCLELLRKVSVGITRVMGHSTGELVCAYADGHLTMEQAITAAFHHDNVASYLQSVMNGNKRQRSSLWLSEGRGEVTPQLFASRLSRMSNHLSSEFASELDNIVIEIGSKAMMCLKGDSGFADPGFAVTNVLGRLFQSGIGMDIEHLYPAVQYPLPASTPFLAPLIKWDHRVPTEIKNFLYDPMVYFSIQTTKNIVFRFDQSRSEDSFLFDHKIDGRSLFPATGYLMITWSAFAKLNRVVPTELPIRFEDVKFHRATVLSTEQETVLSVRINEDMGLFEIKESDFTVVSGKVFVASTLSSTNTILVKPGSSTTDLTLEGKDVYKELRIRGYDYGPYFQAVRSASADGTKGSLIFRDVVTKPIKDSLNLETAEDYANLFLRSWCAFADSILHLHLIRSRSNSRFLIVATSIESLTIFPEEIKKSMQETVFDDLMTSNESSILNVYQDIDAKILHTDGIIVKGFKGSLLQRKKQAAKLLEYKFLPFDMDDCIDADEDDNLIIRYHAALLGGSHDFDLNDEKFALLKRSQKPAKKSEEQKRSEGEIISDNDSGNFSHGETDDRNTMAKDLLVGKSFALSNQLLFKSLLDTSVYNLISTSAKASIDVLEVCITGNDLIVESVKECLADHFLNEQFTVRVNLLYSEPESMDENLKSEYSDVVKIGEKFFDSEADLKSVIPSCNLLIINMSSSDESLNYESVIRHAACSLKENGFMLLVYKDRMDDDICKLLEQEEDKGITGVDRLNRTVKDLPDMKEMARRSLHDKLPFKSILFSKKVKNESREDHLIVVGTENYESWLEQAKELLLQDDDSRVWLTADPKDSCFQNHVTGIIGLVKSLRCEFFGSKVRSLVDFDSKKEIRLADYPDVLSRDLVHNVRLNGKWGSYEHILMPEDAVDDVRSYEPSDHFYLRSLKQGDLSSLSWVRNSIPFNPDQLADHVKVYCSALNFKDILFANGRLPLNGVPAGVSPAACQDSLLGLEYAGIDNNNNRVMGLLPFKGLASTIPLDQCTREFVYDIPESWTFEDAATVPIVYSTVLYALMIRGKLAKNETILIHAGSGGVGLAAINVCLHFDCNIITTCGSDEKRDFIIKFSDGRVRADHIFNSRDKHFEEQVLRLTEGKGVDLILNSLAEEMFDATIRVLSSNGRFMEIGRMDMVNDRGLEITQSLSVNQTFHGVALDTLMRYGDDDHFSTNTLNEKKELIKLMNQGMRDGFVKPLPRVTFTKNKIEQAFRFMGAGKAHRKDCYKNQGRRRCIMCDSSPQKDAPQSFQILCRDRRTGRTGTGARAVAGHQRSKEHRRQLQKRDQQPLPEVHDQQTQVRGSEYRHLTGRLDHKNRHSGSD